MAYSTENEFEHFDFKEAQIAELRRQNESFYAVLDNVKILPENSKNRDIRVMRTNNLTLRLTGVTQLEVIEEGYRTYNADGVLMQQTEDQIIEEAQYATAFESLAGCVLFSLEKENDCYLISIDTDDHTFLLRVTANGDIEEWEHFFSLDSM